MLQPINMLDLRKSVGQVIDRAYYRKERFLIKRKGKPLAVVLPLEDYELFIAEDKNIELYSNRRIKEFEVSDRLSPKQKESAIRLLQS